MVLGGSQSDLARMLPREAVEAGRNFFGEMSIPGSLLPEVFLAPSNVCASFPFDLVVEDFQASAELPSLVAAWGFCSAICRVLQV